MKRRRASLGKTSSHRAAGTRASEGPAVSPRCWVAEASIDRFGNQCESVDPDGLAIFAVCVHEQYPATESLRLKLLRQVGENFRPRVPAGLPSLWMFPGGYFGFNSSAPRDSDEAWPGFDSASVQRQLPVVLSEFPPLGWVAFGADYPDGANVQQAWVYRHTEAGAVKCRVISRGCTDISDRTVDLGVVSATFFVCGEFTGSRSEQNGPFFAGQYLNEPLRQLADCGLLVDLAHIHVPGSVHGSPGPRRVHEAQMMRFSQHGAAVLTHHHGGAMVEGRPRTDHQSNWIVFRGGQWLSTASVTTLP